MSAAMSKGYKVTLGLIGFVAMASIYAIQHDGETNAVVLTPGAEAVLKAEAPLSTEPMRKLSPEDVAKAEKAVREGLFINHFVDDYEFAEKQWLVAYHHGPRPVADEGIEFQQYCMAYRTVLAAYAQVHDTENYQVWLNKPVPKMENWGLRYFCK
jgi:hypothetical protein